MPKKIQSSGKPKYALDDNGCFVLENYNQAEPFSNFFPGVAGLWGIPMWVFYVNRGQCISSFGIESKDKAMLEFLPANKAYRMTSLQGFRTFVKYQRGKKVAAWEPFQPGQEFKTVQKMVITSHDLTIEEVNHTLGVVCRVNYFTIPEEPFPGLVRRVTFENISNKEIALQVVDGLPVFLPYGMNDWALKNMSRTAEAWVKVRNLDKGIGFYQLNVELGDTPDVRHIKEGNFYAAFEEGKKKFLPLVAQPQCVFGQATDFVQAVEFYRQPNFRLPAVQQTESRTPSAMALVKLNLAPRQARTIVAVMGSAHSREQLDDIAEKLMDKQYIPFKSSQNRDVVAGIKNYAFTHSRFPAFNQYAGQTFLDNVMRGGLPVSLKTKEGKIAFNVFSRKHGDPERDYNYFVLSPTYFSQGNGNYRDVNQNRRCDIWFNADVADSSILAFFNLSQADGYNPLVVKGMSFFAHGTATLEEIFKRNVRGDWSSLRPLLEHGFQPGQLLTLIEKNHLTLKCSAQEFLAKALGVCHHRTLADHGEGFWVDHWTYNIDLLESYLSVFPERLRDLLIDKKAFSFYHNDHYVLPREQRYILMPQGVRQYHSVADGSKLIGAKKQGNILRTEDGEGDVYYTNLVAKLLCLTANKVATLDPDGVGIEMEADRPGWYDALNGLPGLLGSSICETLELERYAQFLLDALDRLEIDDGFEFGVFGELGEFIKELVKALTTEENALAYWMRANALKENYRLSVRKGIRGEEEGISAGLVRQFLTAVIERTRKAAAKATDARGLIATYFTYEVLEYEVLEHEHEGKSFVMPKKFKRHALPLFLEGLVHALRVTRDPAKARRMHQAVRASGLYDKALKMYKVNADISGEGEEIGRARVFPRGWLENESIWLHMEYKYLLELLRCGLYTEFYEAMKDAMIPFLKPEVYGRSILESSSFLVSSAHTDPSLHGRGFVARLSGNTAEFLQMWLWMNVGTNPFTVNRRGQLGLQLDPILSKEMFTRQAQTAARLNRDGQWETVEVPKGCYAFHFMGPTLVMYHNPNAKDLFPDGDYRIEKIVLTYSDGKQQSLTDGFVPAPYAQEVRDGKLARVDVHVI